METTEKQKKGGRPKKPEQRKLIIKLALTEKEHKKILALSGQAGLRPAIFCRLAVLGKEVKSKISGADKEQNRALIRMANNLNQLAKKANEQGFEFVQNQVKDILMVINKIIDNDR